MICRLLAGKTSDERPACADSDGSSSSGEGDLEESDAYVGSDLGEGERASRRRRFCGRIDSFAMLGNGGVLAGVMLGDREVVGGTMLGGEGVDDGDNLIGVETDEESIGTKGHKGA